MRKATYQNALYAAKFRLSFGVDTLGDLPNRLFRRNFAAVIEKVSINQRSETRIAQKTKRTYEERKQKEQAAHGVTLQA